MCIHTHDNQDYAKRVGNRDCITSSLSVCIVKFARIRSTAELLLETPLLLY